MVLVNTIISVFRAINKSLILLTPFFDLFARIWVAHIFFRAGLLKIQSWGSTLYLFEYEFQVPILSPEIAAYLGTAAELVLPILLVLGLGGRITTLVFFIYNLIAIISYPLLWTPEGGQALDQHIVWGLLLGLLMTHGTGKISLDYMINKYITGKWKV